MTASRNLCLAIDTASDFAGLALLEDGSLLADASWRSRQSHSRQLLPSLEWLLAQVGCGKADLGAIFVCLGPGSYAGLRVGISTAKALAFGLEAPLAGVGRLAADAYAPSLARGGRVWSVHAAGRAELAWAAYSWQSGRLVELEAPRLGPSGGLVTLLQSGDAVVAEAGALDAELSKDLESRGVAVLPASAPRAPAIAMLGWQRLQDGDLDDADRLTPLYLRAPAIGPQPQR